MSTNIQFRTKFLKEIPRGSQLNMILHEYASDFINLQPAKALRLLWKMTYAPNRFYIRISDEHLEQARTELELITLDISPDIFHICIPNDLSILVRNELRHHYHELHNGFPEFNVPDSCKDEVKSFKRFLDDPITAAVVVHRCNEYIERLKYPYTPATNMTIPLLKHSMEAKYFGGLLEIGFNHDEARYLKGYASRIADILQALLKHQTKTFEETYHITHTCEEEKPDASKVQFSEPTTTTMLSNEEGFSAHTVMEHQETFKAFFDFEASMSDYSNALRTFNDAHASLVMYSDAMMESSSELDFNEVRTAFVEAYEVLIERMKLIEEYHKVSSKLETLGIKPEFLMEKSETIKQLLSALEAFNF